MAQDNHNPGEKDIQRLLRKRSKLEEELKKIESRLREHTKASGSKRERGRPVRVVLLDALEELGTLAYSRELALYVRARYGQDIPLPRFGTLGSDESKAFRSDRSRPVYLCHGLTGERFEPIKRLWARSDWPLWQRIVAPTTGRIQHLQMTAKLCEIAISTPASGESDSLRIIAADHARALPGIKFQRGKFDLEDWRNVAIAELVKWAPQDEGQRKAAAERLKNSDVYYQCFGMPENHLATVPRTERNGTQGA